jgi:DNA-binding NtrC family response regulator
LFAEANGVEQSAITAETALRMMEYEWPGNVREMENAVERMLVTDLGASVARFSEPDQAVKSRRRLWSARSTGGTERVERTSRTAWRAHACDEAQPAADTTPRTAEPPPEPNPTDELHPLASRRP